ncbi:MAG: hypothetical protein D3920_05690 [Candidatus Electrothrix sp. AW2]|nr:hypothetical protein [Candidatus Electrothrix gigas]MCI5191899.1 hypothetical protein [Candidatus Electrothrix gigas]
MKTTLYFNHTRQRPDRAKIRMEWIQQVIDHPEKIVIQSDGRVRKWAKIAEENKYLRVILLEDGETVHNAFFDRSFREEKA